MTISVAVAEPKRLDKLFEEKDGAYQVENPDYRWWLDGPQPH